MLRVSSLKEFLRFTLSQRSFTTPRVMVVDQRLLSSRKAYRSNTRFHEDSGINQNVFLNCLEFSKFYRIFVYVVFPSNNILYLYASVSHIMQLCLHFTAKWCPQSAFIIALNFISDTQFSNKNLHISQ